MVGDDIDTGSTSAAAALEVLGVLRSNVVEAWVAGGWGVDALLGEQTREHRDLDILIPNERSLAVYEARAVRNG